MARVEYGLLSFNEVRPGSSQGSFPYALVAPASRVSWVAEAGHPCKYDRRPIFTRARRGSDNEQVCLPCDNLLYHTRRNDIVKQSQPRRSTAVKATVKGRQDVSLWQSALQYGRPSLHLPPASHGARSERANMMSQQLFSSSMPSLSSQKTVSSRAVRVTSLFCSCSQFHPKANIKRLG